MLDKISSKFQSYVLLSFISAFDICLSNRKVVTRSYTIISLILSPGHHGGEWGINFNEVRVREGTRA